MRFAYGASVPIETIGSPGNIQIVLTRAPDDPPQFDSAYQDGVSVLLRSLRAEGVEVNARFSFRDSIAAAGGFTGELTVLARSIGPSITLVIGACIGKWLESRNGRKVRMKVGEIEVEANSVGDVEKLLARALEVQKSAAPNKIISPDR